MNPRKKAIHNAIKSFGSTSHPSKKAAPGIHYKDLTPKEKYHREAHGARMNKRLELFNKSGYGRHLTERARRRGEQD